MQNNYLTVIEGNTIRTYNMDDKDKWTVGRPSTESIPDISFHSRTISRNHGVFNNTDGIWFYVDGYGKNGTIYNGKKLVQKNKRRSKPILLNDNDVLILGGDNTPVIDPRTVFILYTNGISEFNWRILNTDNAYDITFMTDEEEQTLHASRKGAVVRLGNNIAIYMGDITYVSGDIRIAYN